MMEYIICIVTISILIIFAFITSKKLKQNIQQIKEKEKQINKLKTEESAIELKIEEKSTSLNNIIQEISSKSKFNNDLKKIREEELDRLLSEKKKLKELSIEHEIEEWQASAQEAASENFQLQYENFNKEKINLIEQIQQLHNELEDFRRRREVINQEILRSRALEEQQDFYRIQLDENSKKDIETLNSIRTKLIKIDLLNKLIYDNYIKKPTDEMAKRVLCGRDPSGIYKVTNISTKEIYIGKSTTIGTRWHNHVKSAYGLAGVAESQFQRALKKYGIDNFTWELLEEVPKQQLGEREKHYIDFYGSKTYGYNQKEGG